MNIEIISGLIKTKVKCKGCDLKQDFEIEVTPKELKEGKIKEEISKLICRCKK